VCSSYKVWLITNINFGGLSLYRTKKTLTLKGAPLVDDKISPLKLVSF
jgi:hypothetical protein